MNFTDEQITALQAPLDASTIKHRPGAGKMLKYIKGDTAIDTANRIFSFGQWGYRVVGREHEIIDDPKKGKIEVYTADVELSVTGAAFTFPGDGVGIVNDPYTVEMHEKARKDATTDALKRALRHYGDQFGLCLYDQDDYVAAADGTLIQVKEVKPGQAPQPKRIVDASKPALPAAGEATSSERITSAQLSSIRNLCKLLGREMATDESCGQQNAKETIVELSKQA